MRRGFTLLELSIVLVIIGLIVGGITVGQELINSAELNAAVKEHEQLKVAVNSFKLKYNAIPGDMGNATDYWGAAHVNPTTCVSTAGSGTETCNGNGDRKLITRLSDDLAEGIRFWQHLNNAQMWEGEFSGLPGSGDSEHLDETNSPKSTFGNSLLGIVNLNVTVIIGSMHFFAGLYYDNMLILGAASNKGYNEVAAFTPIQTYNIDRKIDDGLPSKGAFRAHYNDCTYAATAIELDTTYNLTNDDVVCTPYYYDIF